MSDEFVGPKLEEEFHAVMEEIKVEDIDLPESIQKIEFQDSVLDMTEDDIPFPSLCRLCATQADNMIDMFGQTEMHDNIIEKIQYCLPIAVHKTDILPKEACELCLAKLELSYQFIKNVVKAEQRLLTFDKQISTNHNKRMEEYPQFSSLPIGHNDTTDKQPKEEGFNTTRDIDNFQMIILTPELVITDTSDHNTFNLNNIDKNMRASSSSNVYQNRGACSNPLNSAAGSMRPDKEMRPMFNSETYFPPVARGKGKRKNNLSKKTSRKHKPPSCNTSEHTQSQFKSQGESNTDDGNRDYTFECTICKRRFGSRHVLEIHSETCQKPLPLKKRFICDFCMKSFAWKSDLIVHMRIHTGGKLYSCEFCPKKFTKKSHKDNHHRTHTGERPYSCNFCPKRFKRQSDRDNHHRIHTGERPYSCDFCTKKFTSRNARAEHQRTHTGERPFECPICKVSFATGSARWYHILTHTSQKPFQCDMCKKCFSLRKYLLRHKGLCQINV